MPGNTANIEVSGSAAASITSGLLNALGIEPGDIEEADIRVALNSEGETSVALVADGPNAGNITAEMFGGVEWEDYQVVSIDADVTEREGPAGSTTTEENSTTSSSTGAFQPQVMPLVGEVDPEYVEFPGEPPERIRENTQLHVIGNVLMQWYEDHDGGWVSTTILSEYDPNPLSEKQTQSAASRLFLHSGLVVRRHHPDATGREYEYHPTKQLGEEMSRLGDYSMPEVEETRDKRTPEDVDAEM